MSTNQPRKPAGTPVGGQWAPMAHDEADVDLNPRVHRSPGTIVTIGGTGAIVGGGGHGLTPELDAAVDEAALSMAERFGTNVEIRFNSDRRRGGAWLVTHPGKNSVWDNTWVGINAQLSRTRAEAEANAGPGHYSWDDDDEWARYLDGCDGQVHITVRVSEEALRDRSLGSYKSPGRSKVFEREVPDVTTAAALVAQVSIAGDAAEIERRRKLTESYGQERRVLRDRANEHWAKAHQGLSTEDSEKLRNEMLAEYNQADAQLLERFWADIDGGS